MTGGDTLARIDAHMECGNELLAWIDAHLERGITDFSPEHLARGAELAARIDEHVVRCEEVIAASGESYDGWRFSMRQDSLRNERVLGEMSQSLNRNTDRVDELIAEGRAQRAALWKLLDRLPEPDSPEPATG